MTPDSTVADRPPRRETRHLGKIVVIAVLICGVLAARAFWLEPASLELREYRLKILNWPRSLGGLRIAALADFHVGSPFNGLDKLERIVGMSSGVMSWHRAVRVN